MGSSNNFNGNFGGDYVNGDKHSNRPDSPPENHPNAIECPQCWKLTWRGTQHCIHCEYDIEAYLYSLDRTRRKAFFDKRVSQFYIVGLILLGVSLILMQFTSSLVVAILFIIALVLVGMASNAKFQG